MLKRRRFQILHFRVKDLKGSPFGAPQILHFRVKNFFRAKNFAKDFYSEGSAPRVTAMWANSPPRSRWTWT
ncbi:MAG: hypothetical protein JWL77_5183 [Chthonomonadaceae bacterium]|nr:hypothetical protein [Chthonomonadaceae bacterium]